MNRREFEFVSYNVLSDVKLFFVDIAFFATCTCIRSLSCSACFPAKWMSTARMNPIIWRRGFRAA